MVRVATTPRPFPGSRHTQYIGSLSLGDVLGDTGLLFRNLFINDVMAFCGSPIAVDVAGRLRDDVGNTLMHLIQGLVPRSAAPFALDAGKVILVNHSCWLWKSFPSCTQYFPVLPLKRVPVLAVHLESIQLHDPPYESHVTPELRVVKKPSLSLMAMSILYVVHIHRDP